MVVKPPHPDDLEKFELSGHITQRQGNSIKEYAAVVGASIQYCIGQLIEEAVKDKEFIRLRDEKKAAGVDITAPPKPTRRPRTPSSLPTWAPPRPPEKTERVS